VALCSLERITNSQVAQEVEDWLWTWERDRSRRRGGRISSTFDKIELKGEERRRVLQNEKGSRKVDITSWCETGKNLDQRVCFSAYVGKRPEGGSRGFFNFLGVSWGPREEKKTLGSVLTYRRPSISLKRELQP